MFSAFQQNSFQNNSFQVDGATATQVIGGGKSLAELNDHTQSYGNYFPINEKPIQQIIDEQEARDKQRALDDAARQEVIEKSKERLIAAGKEAVLNKKAAYLTEQQLMMERRRNEEVAFIIMSLPFV